MSQMSEATRALLRAAKGDGPSTAARAKIWTGVSSAAAAGASAAGAAASVGSSTAPIGTAGAAGASAGAGKLMAFGALLGSAVTVGIAALALRVGGPAPLPQDSAPRVEHAVVGEGVSLRSKASVEAFAAPHRAEQPKPQADATGAALADEDALTRESMLVAEARGALRRGDAERALAAARSAKAIRGAQLEPEALSVEIGALRALAREADAMSVELELKRKYPGHALAR